MVHISIPTEKDIPQIAPLIQEYFPYTQIDEFELARRMASPVFFYHIAREKNTFAGYAEWEIIDEKNRIVRLNGIAILPKFQGKGLAHALMNAGESMAREKKMQKMILLVSETNNEAKKLYEKNKWNYSRTHIKKINGKKTEVWEKEIK
ncbi:MAG: GNAT family N-acetyltransferase [Candidatus Diapherotrites archaeon]|uniref:GNAT family N-acetyltransferase n=1 Tax=Candidatus Iainarchaeum sp. TaxID=3101447 RepID=A0A8T4C750_9ARCH|nr:GNAT family N-acetyltransferase [Candidatus Diapherotrites archaeon]